MQKLQKFLATGAYSGYFPVAPGTFGSLVILTAYWLAPSVSPLLLAAFIILFFLIGLWSSTPVEEALGKDPPVVVIDEMTGMLIALWWIPKTLLLVALAFFLFRFFDVIKPFPARRSQNLPGGWGIMMDDVWAGLYANLIVQVVARVIWNDGCRDYFGWG